MKYNFKDWLDSLFIVYYSFNGFICIQRSLQALKIERFSWKLITFIIQMPNEGTMPYSFKAIAMSRLD